MKSQIIYESTDYLYQEAEIMRKVYRPACFFTIFLLLLSCSPTELKSTWKDKDYTGGNFKTIMIVGVSENLKNRKLFEDTFVKRLKSIGVEAVASYTITPPSKKLDKETIKAAAQKTRVEAVLVTHLVGVEKKDVYVPPISHPAPYGRHYQFDNYLRSVVDYVHEPGYYTQQEYVKLESNLFETGTEKMIWSTTSETIEPRSLGEVIDSLCKAVIKSLRDHHLIR
jgi:hypothetical protein